MLFEPLDKEKEKERQKRLVWGVFYFDVNDKRLFVRRPSRYWPTLNFANKWAYLVFLLFLTALIIGVLGKAGVIK